MVAQMHSSWDLIGTDLIRRQRKKAQNDESHTVKVFRNFLFRRTTSYKH
ncbi:MAG: hypothetical protein JWS12_232 [Candidatus Saccharibacteria bacterium]|nr:hypothetical protein [Candidatus Saccharibacteria bacterium]